MYIVYYIYIYILFIVCIVYAGYQNTNYAHAGALQHERERVEVGRHGLNSCSFYCCCPCYLCCTVPRTKAVTVSDAQQRLLPVPCAFCPQPLPRTHMLPQTLPTFFFFCCILPPAPPHWQHHQTARFQVAEAIARAEVVECLEYVHRLHKKLL